MSTPAPPEIPTTYGLSRAEANELVWALVESGTDVSVVRASVLGVLSAEVASGAPHADRILGYGWALQTVEEIEHAISEGTY